jgi:hypothetical protein
MQFNLTDGPLSTWQRNGVDGDRDGSKDVYDPDDSIHSAANYLRTLLRNAGGDIRQAIFGYNHSHAYVNDVLARARSYASDVAVATDRCASGVDALVGCANVRAAQRLTAPRAFKTLEAAIDVLGDALGTHREDAFRRVPVTADQANACEDVHKFRSVNYRPWLTSQGTEKPRRLAHQQSDAGVPAA